MTEIISERIAILRILMICGVVLLHVPPYVPLADVGSGNFDFLKAFFQSAVFRCTVPVLTVISGYLLFSANLDRAPRKLFVKKFNTLAIPFLVFNTSLAGVVYVIQSKVSLPITYQLAPFDLGVMLDAAFGLTQSPLNYPLNFIRDLFVLAMLAPALGVMLRQAALPGLALVALIFGLDLDSYLLLRWDMAVLFYVGGMAALQKWDLCCLDKYAVAFLALFVSLCVIVIKLKITNTTFLRLAAPFLIWPSASLLYNTRSGRWLSSLSKYSYFIFLAHGLILVITWMVYKKLPFVLPYPFYWILAPLITVVMLINTHRLGYVLFPIAFAWMIGQRVDREKGVRVIPT